MSDYADDFVDFDGERRKEITEITQATGLVTVKTSDDGDVYLQYKSYKLKPYGLEFVRQQRAMASMIVYPEKTGPENDMYKCDLEWIEPLDEGRFGEPAVGNAPFDILVTSEFTGVEDGYLTIHYNTWWGETPKHHDFYLASSPEEPYALALVQDSHGDSQDTLGDGLICFDINDLPDTGGKTLTISLSWTKLNGSQGTVYFGFKSRE